jgi:hypothetical protein
MNTLDIFIDTSNRSLVSSQTGGASIQASSLPFFYPDTLTVRVFLLTPISNNSFGVPQYQIIPTTGLALVLYINGGTDTGSNLAAQTVWQTDPNNTYFYADVSLATAGIKQNLGQKTSCQVYLQIGTIQNGNTRTYISSPITIQAGLNNANLVVPPSLTPLSLQAATAMFVPINGLPAGQGFYLITPNGKKLYLQAVDNPDGTASFLASPVN